MLAYVFWHWRKDSVSASSYEGALQRFHQILSANAPVGFLRSSAFAISGAPWANAGRSAYEDWYVVEGSAALDPLNEAAVSGHRQASHDEAAAGAAGGTAGLYRLRRGAPVSEPAMAYWFAKPTELPYEAFYQKLEGILKRPNVALWGRQMTLGPSPEFCLQSAESLVLPMKVEMAVPLKRVWPGDDTG